MLAEELKDIYQTSHVTVHAMVTVHRFLKSVWLLFIAREAALQASVI